MIGLCFSYKRRHITPDLLARSTEKPLVAIQSVWLWNDELVCIAEQVQSRLLESCLCGRMFLAPWHRNSLSNCIVTSPSINYFKRCVSAEYSQDRSVPWFWKYPTPVYGANWATWQPGTCQVGRLVRRPDEPPRLMVKEKLNVGGAFGYGGKAILDKLFANNLVLVTTLLMGPVCLICQGQFQEPVGPCPSTE